MHKFKNKIQVTKSSLPPINEYIDIIKDIWKTNLLTNNGPIHNKFQIDLSNYLNVPNSVLFTNGHSALDIAIKALNLTGEVITTAFTFASTTHAIVLNNLTPIFCDINNTDFTIDVNKIESLITDKTSAIIPVHVFGYPCDVDKINEIAKKYNLKVIYDSAHAFGVEINGIGIGNFGDISMFSLHATKVFNSIEGGVLTYKDKSLTDTLNMLKNFGITGYETVDSVGENAKMNEFQAAMGLANLKYIDINIKKRKLISETYKNSFKDISGIYYLNDINGVKHNYSYFPILINEKILGIDRNSLYEKLKEYNVFTRKYFYPLTTDFNCYKNYFYNYNLPVSKYIADRILTLPIYSDLSIIDTQNIAAIIKYIIKNYQ